MTLDNRLKLCLLITELRVTKTEWIRGAAPPKVLSGTDILHLLTRCNIGHLQQESHRDSLNMRADSFGHCSRFMVKGEVVKVKTLKKKGWGCRSI